MKTPPPEISSALRDVRAAYRLLHDYQRAAIDTAIYIADQFGFRQNGGWPRLGDAAPQSGYFAGKPAWNWLNLVLFEFHFLRGDANVGLQSLSVLLISDTGLVGCAREPAPAPCSFAPIDQSSTKVGVLFSHGHWKQLSFLDDPKKFREFIESGKLADETENGVTIHGKCYDFAELLDEAHCSRVISDLLDYSLGTDMPLTRADPSSALISTNARPEPT